MALAVVTSHGHTVVMRRVGVAELKARLSEYLRAVRRGETIAVLDRDTPVAQLSPYQERPTLRVRPPAETATPLSRIRIAKQVSPHVDVVELLLEERQASR
jgi:prevent-host-death family protein